jgi:RND family efflux transporter MFP subunit
MGKIPSRIATSLAIAALATCSPPDEQTEAVRPVQTFVLNSGVDAPFRSFPGEVTAAESIEMSFDVPGRLIQFPATQGLIVQAGDLLGALDPVNFENEVAAATARFNNARDELARRRPLRESGAISVSQFDQSVREVEVTTAALQTARRALDDTRLKAPFDGRVGRTLVNNGENVRNKQPVLLLQNLSMLEIDIQVPESDMLVFQQGLTPENARTKLEAQALFATLPDKRFDLELQSFSTEATQAARTFKVTFSFKPPAEHNILPGMTSTVFLRLKRDGSSPAGDGVFLVPTGAVATAEGRTWVWKLNPETSQVSRHEVEMISKNGKSIQIRSADLKQGDELVTAGARFLTEGMTVSRMR